MSAVVIVLSFVSLVLTVLYLALKWRYSYWRRRRVPFLKPTLILGNYGDAILVRKTPGEVTQKICQAFPDAPYVGAFFGTEPTLIVQDPELIKLITTKDFPYFNGREVSKYTNKEVATGNLFFTYGDRWKAIRQIMTPLFTASKIKNMFHLVAKCACMLEDLIEREIKFSDEFVAKDLMARYSIDCTCSNGFGVDTNTMAADVDIKSNPFFKMGDALFEATTKRALAHMGRSVWPSIFYGLGFKVYPNIIDKFFASLLIDVFKSRNYEPSGRNDFVDMVLNLKKNDHITCDCLLPSAKGQKVNMKVDDDFLLGQCIVFFAAGYETSSTTASFTLLELAKNQDVQDRAIAEVDDYLRRHNGKIEYDCVNELTYLNACVDETLRYYPVLTILTREVMEDYRLPDGLLLEKGVRIHLPIYHLHHHPKHFPEPELYRPERFLPEEKAKIKPYTYMPFGEGPRICIGLRVGKMQVLPGLVTVLKKYRVQLAPGTSGNLKMEARAMVTQAHENFRLKFVPRANYTMYNRQ